MQRISKMLSSVRFRLVAVFMLLMTAAMVSLDISVIENAGASLIKQRVDYRRTMVANLATTTAEAFHDKARMNEIIMQYSGANSCRVMLFSPVSVVTDDTYGKFIGRQIANKQVNDCLEGEPFSWDEYFLEENDGYWAVYYAVPVTVGENTAAVLLVSESFQDIVDNISALTVRTVGISVVIGVLLGVLVLLTVRKSFSPLREMSDAIGLMAAGDFSARASVRGKSELAELAKAFNNMCSRMETLDESRNKFVSDASHEMKTPLASMKILIDTVITQPDMPPELRTEFLNDVRHEIERINNLIVDLLALVRMDDAVREENPVPIQLTDLLDKVRHKLLPIAAEKNIEIKFEPIDDITVNGNAARLQQAFFNLVDNAVKYSGEGTVVTVRAIRRARNAVVEIEDHGLGISKEDQLHIFERFYRVDKARSRETGGTGLGLSIVDNIIKMHNGTILIKSKLGEGTTFTVLLEAL